MYRFRNDNGINYVNLDEKEVFLEAGTNLGSGEYLNKAPPDSVYNVTDGTKDKGVDFRPLKAKDIQGDDPERITEVLAVLGLEYR